MEAFAIYFKYVRGDRASLESLRNMTEVVGCCRDRHLHCSARHNFDWLPPAGQVECQETLFQDCMVRACRKILGLSQQIWITSEYDEQIRKRDRLDNMLRLVQP